MRSNGPGIWRSSDTTRTWDWISQLNHRFKRDNGTVIKYHMRQREMIGFVAGSVLYTICGWELPPGTSYYQCFPTLAIFRYVDFSSQNYYSLDMLPVHFWGLEVDILGNGQSWEILNYLLPRIKTSFLVVI